MSGIEAELADLQRTVEDQDITINAVGGVMLSLFEFLANALIDRTEIVKRLQQIVDRERADTEREERERDALRTLPPDRPWRDLEIQKREHALLDEIIRRLTPTESETSSPPAPTLRIVKGSEEEG